MLTPVFSLEQSNEFVTLKLKCPYIKAQEVEIDVQGTEFRFFCHPYFLRLHFPHALVEDGREKSQYDISSGTVIITLPKEQPVHFEDLEMLTKLMDIKTQPTVKAPAIVMMDDESVDEIDTKIDENEIEFDWNFQQELPKEQLLGSKYGFNNQYQGFGSAINELAREILDIDNIENSTPKDKREFRMRCEELKFDKEYYMYDYAMNQDIKQIIEFKPTSWKMLSKLQKDAQDESVCKYLEFNESERTVLKDLPNKEYIIDEDMRVPVYLGLVDILYAYCFNHRITEGEDTVESAWTICKLSGTLSSFDIFTSLEEVLACALRRSLAYPLFRSFELYTKVVKDVMILMKLGRKAILKALIQMRALFNTHDNLYILDRIYITDYTIWIQKASDKQIGSLASTLNHTKLTKQLCGWDLEVLEKEAIERRNEIIED